MEIAPRVMWIEQDKFIERDAEGGHNHAQHFNPGMKTLYLEMNCETQLYGEEQTLIELLPGFSHVLAESAEL